MIDTFVSSKCTIGTSKLVDYVFYFAHAQMISRGGGSIINMASMTSSKRGVERRSVYGAAKGAVIGLTKAMAKEHVRDGIRYFDVSFIQY